MSRLPHRYLIGLDLGQKRDFTALAILCQRPERTGRQTVAPVDFRLDGGVIYDYVPVVEHAYDLVHLERWRGEPYHRVVPKIDALTRRLRQTDRDQQVDAGISLPVDPTITRIVDATGVGLAVVDTLRAAGLSCVAITIHGGDAVGGDLDNLRVPKRALVGVMQVLLENRRFIIPRRLALRETLTSELENFRAEIKLATGHDTYGAGADWREHNHDDLVLAVALAAWYGEDEASKNASGIYGERWAVPEF